MRDKHYEDVRVEGHLIDSQIMSDIMDSVVALEGEFETLEFRVGRTNEDVSNAVLRIVGNDEAHLDELLGAVQAHGAVSLEPDDVALEPAPGDGVFPETFYSTTNLETSIRLSGRWLPVSWPEMDCGIRVDPKTGRAETVPVAEVKKGDLIAAGRRGVRVIPLSRGRERQQFEFMSSEVSSEKPKAQVVREIAELLSDVRSRGGVITWVVGPAVVHTGAADDLARLVKCGYVGVVLGGNAIAVHDIEAALYGTSLGVSLRDGVPTHEGHEHHIRAINRIRAAGGIPQAVESGLLGEGLFHTLVSTGTPFVLSGSIRDDGPLPDVITDVIESQRQMRLWARKTDACIMLSSMLHSIAVGNVLPARAHAVCVDINPAVVTKLADRGSFQTTGVVTDVGLFLRLLADELDS